MFLSFAKEQPHDFLRLVNTYTNVEVAEVQALVAEGFAAANVALANEAVEYLLGDCKSACNRSVCVGSLNAPLVDVFMPS